MVDLQGQVVPKTEEEYQLLNDIYAVTGEAFENGVDRESISVSLQFAAMSILASEDTGTVEQPPEGSDIEPREDCPNCGGNIEDVRAFIGGDAEVSPCGCYVEVAEVPGWLDDV